MIEKHEYKSKEREILARYKRGEESREKILKAARNCFFTYGYKKTTVAMIAAKAEVPQSLITYYYKKDQLLVQIYEKFVNFVMDEIDRQVGHLLENSLQRHLLIMQIPYLCICSDENSYAVYRHMLENRLYSSVVFKRVDDSLMKCLKDFCIDLDEDTFRMYISAQFGAHRELVQLHLQEYDVEKSKALFCFTGTIALRLAGVSQRVIDANIQKTNELLALMDLSGIHLLA